MVRKALIELFRQPQTLRLTIAGLIGRLPTGMVGLALVLFVYDRTQSFAAAGSVSAAFGIFAGIVAPLQGRLVDRFGQPRLLFPTAVLDAISLTAIVVAGYRDAPLGALIGLAALAGSVRPPLSACVRSVWPAVLPKGRVLESVYALEGVLIEVIFIVGPLLVAILAALAAPGAALLVAAALSLAGTLWFATSAPSKAWRSEPKEKPSWAGPLVGSGIRTLLVSGLAVGLAFGMLEVAVPAFSEAHGQAAAAGISFAAMAAGSMVAGLWYGSREWKISVPRRYLFFLSFFAVGFVPLAFATSIAMLVLLMAVAGLALGPAVASGYVLIGDTAPRGTLAEAYSWASTANLGGTSIGAAMSGILVEQIDFRFAFAAAGVFVAGGAMAAFLWRSTLEPQTKPVVP